MKTIAHLAEWCAGAEQEFGDPTIPVGQMFLRYLPTLIGYEGEDLAASTEGDGSLIIRLALDTVLRIRVSEQGPEGSLDRLEVFGLMRVTSGVWGLLPSMNLPGLVHAWTVIYNVPEPAPWGKRIVLVG